MTSPQAAKGGKWEREVLSFFRANGYPRAYRPRQEGYEDVGDIHAGGMVLQAKDWSNWQAAIREGLDGAVVQAENANRAMRAGMLGAAVVKRARRGVGDGYVVMRLSDFVRLMDR
jgi:hypothetical protein